MGVMKNSIPVNKIICGDCEKVLKLFPENCIHLIITSPPYADRRKKTYGGINPNEYVEWFLPKADQFLRVLKPNGTFILNIKEKVVNGERHTYVIELILALKKQGWLWTEEFIWHKKNCYPGKWSNRFRDAWERCLQFNKRRKFSIYQDSVKAYIGEWAESRLRNISKSDIVRLVSSSKSGFGRKVANWIGKRKVYPTNVLHLPTICRNRNHSAVFPLDLPRWFIKLFTKNGDIVLDPFVGSGTTAMACVQTGRKYIGIDIDKNNCELARKNLNLFKKTISIKR